MGKAWSWVPWKQRKLEEAGIQLGPFPAIGCHKYNPGRLGPVHLELTVPWAWDMITAFITSLSASLLENRGKDGALGAGQRV